MRKSLIAVALGAAIVSAPAAAQWASPMWSQAYVGAGAGRADAEDLGGTDGRENSWKVFAGIGFNETVGAELAYNDLGSYNNIDVTSWSLAATAQWPLDPMWYVMAKLGATMNNIDNGVDDDRTDLLAGVGVGVRFNKNLGARLEYEHFGDLPEEGPGFERQKLQNVSLSLTYAFP